MQFTVPMWWSRITLTNILCKLKYAMIHTIPRQRPGSLGERPVPVYRELKHKDNSTAQSWEHRIPCFQYYMVQGRGRQAGRLAGRPAGKPAGRLTCRRLCCAKWIIHWRTAVSGIQVFQLWISNLPHAWTTCCCQRIHPSQYPPWIEVCKDKENKPLYAKI